MPVPKWLLAGVGALVVLFVGGLLGAAMADDPRATDTRAAGRRSPEPAVPPRPPEPQQPVNVMIVLAGPPPGPPGPGGSSGPPGPAVRTTRVAPDAYAGRAPLPMSMPRQRFTSSASPWRSVASASGPPPHNWGNRPGMPRLAGLTHHGGAAWTIPTAAGPISLQGLGGPEGFSVSANGTNIVIANDGSIVSVGDNTVLTANTGDASSSGVIALDVVDSALTSGDSDLSGSTVETSGMAPASPTGTPTSVSTAGTRTPPAGGGPDTRAVAIAGYENRRLDIAGNDNLLTNNDSNLFYHRIGHLNGSTGDTQTSGLNVVDATGSEVQTGDSGPPPGDPAPSDQPGVVPSGAAPASAPAPGPAPAPGAATASVDSAGTATATGEDSLAIGGRGLVDAGMQTRGDRNVTTSDDGNVTVGGTGDVNAQSGDSDTSGAEVMDVTDTEITTGSSTPPAGEQASTPAPPASPAHDPHDDLATSDPGHEMRTAP